MGPESIWDLSLLGSERVNLSFGGPWNSRTLHARAGFSGNSVATLHARAPR